MLKYRALYKKMMDDLKDAGMWADWAKDLWDTDKDVADYFIKIANERINNSYMDTKRKFDELIKREGMMPMAELINEQLDGWCDEVLLKLSKMRS